MFSLMLFMCGQPIKVDIELYPISQNAMEYGKNEWMNTENIWDWFSYKIQFLQQRGSP